MFEFDFLPVTNATGEGTTKSGDAICGRFIDRYGHSRVFVVDAGFEATGEALVDHIRTYYNTHRVDLVISTHPDGDHINGLATVINELEVTELMIHQPRLHTGYRVSTFRNIEAVDALLQAARDNGTAITEPFTGEQRLDGHLLVLGPDEGFYKELLDEHLNEIGESKGFRFSNVQRQARNLLATALSYLPQVESLTDAGETDPRNETSVVTLLQVDGERFLLTGDAGQRALARVADEYEALIGPFAQYPLHMLQVPHHGSRRNVGPTILDRILGPQGAPHATTSAIISAAENAPKHPSPKVVNALLRRGARPVLTAGTTICHPSSDAPDRGWGPVAPLPPLDEGDDVDD